MPPKPRGRIKIEGYPKQMEFIQTPVFESAFIGGVGSGKSHAGALKALTYCMANPGAWGIVTAPQVRVLEIGTIPTYQKIFPREIIDSEKYRPHPEWKLVNGCRIFFWSTDKPETISAAELAFSHMDEGSLSPYLAYLNVKKRLRQRDAEGRPYPYQLWVTTTPRQLNWLYQEITRKTNPLHLITACTKENIYLTMRDEAGNILETPESYIKRLGLTGKAYEQEIEGKFVSLLGECLFSQETIDLQLANCIEPLASKDNGMTTIWKEPVVGGRYIAAADCADEGGGGVNDLIIADAQTGEEVAELNADIPADRFAVLAWDLLREYYQPLFAPERNGTVGGIVTTKFKDMGYPTLYRDDKGKEGWYTSTSAYPPKVSRFTMLSEFEEAVRKRQWIIHSSDCIGEMSTFVRDEGGKYGHREGYKDDRIMARAICWQLRKEAPRNRIGFASFKRLATTYN